MEDGRSSKETLKEVILRRLLRRLFLSLKILDRLELDSNDSNDMFGAFGCQAPEQGGKGLG